MRICILAILFAAAIVSTAQKPEEPSLNHNDEILTTHRFTDKTNLKLQGINIASQTMALFSIQSQDNGGGMAACADTPCMGALEARGRTWDPFEKHFESHGYGWGALYRYGGGVGLNMLVAYIFHATGHHKLERWVPTVAIMHGQASTAYALTGSRQGKAGS